MKMTIWEKMPLAFNNLEIKGESSEIFHIAME